MFWQGPAEQVLWIRRRVLDDTRLQARRTPSPPHTPFSLLIGTMIAHSSSPPALCRYASAPDCLDGDAPAKAADLSFVGPWQADSYYRLVQQDGDARRLALFIAAKVLPHTHAQRICQHAHTQRHTQTHTTTTTTTHHKLRQSCKPPAAPSSRAGCGGCGGHLRRGILGGVSKD